MNIISPTQYFLLLLLIWPRASRGNLIILSHLHRSSSLCCNNVYTLSSTLGSCRVIETGYNNGSIFLPFFFLYLFISFLIHPTMAIPLSKLIFNSTSTLLSSNKSLSFVHVGRCIIWIVGFTSTALVVRQKTHYNTLANSLTVFKYLQLKRELLGHCLTRQKRKILG